MSTDSTNNNQHSSVSPVSYVRLLHLSAFSLRHNSGAIHCYKHPMTSSVLTHPYSFFSSLSSAARSSFSGATFFSHLSHLAILYLSFLSVPCASSFCFPTFIPLPSFLPSFFQLQLSTLFHRPSFNSATSTTHHPSSLPCALLSVPFSAPSSCISPSLNSHTCNILLQLHSSISPGFLLQLRRRRRPDHPHQYVLSSSLLYI